MTPRLRSSLRCSGQGRAAILLVALTLVALAGPWLSPYDPGDAHRDFLFAPPMPPRVVSDSGLHAPFVYPVVLADRLSQRYEEDRARRLPLPWFTSTKGTEKTATEDTEHTEGRSPAFLLGADSFGRDVLSRVLHGARRSIGLALAATLGALLIGSLVGGFAGYRGGLIDESVMRVADFVLVLPVIYVVLVLRSVMPLVLPPATIFLLMTGIFALVGWPFVARGVRGITSAERDREYVLAAQSLGASHARVFLRHVLPACAGYLLVQATLLLPAFILAEATLSYVGLGFPEDLPTWGTMLADAADLNVITRFPWMLTPAVAIFAVVFSANVMLQGSRRLSDRPV
jgi:peptide/nickel transport system permease protein